MGKMVLMDCRLFVSGVDLSGQSNQIEIEDEAEAKEVTNWRSGGAKEVIAGLRGPSLTASGQWEAGDPGKVDDAMWANRRVIEGWIVGPTDEGETTVGALAYLTRALRTSAKLLGQVGDVAPWDLAATGSWPLVRGQYLHASGVERTASGTGTIRQVGAPTVGQSVYVVAQCLSVAGTSNPTLTLTVQSDDAVGFTTPTTRATLTGMTAAGQAQNVEIPGPITDDYWRLGWTITGSSPGFLFVVAIGID